MAGIVVATDLSTAAEAGIVQAAQWARRLGCPLTILHVVHDPLLAPALAHDVAGDVARARERLAATVHDRCAAVPTVIDVRTAEDVATAIAAAADELGADWLFVGTQGGSGLRRLQLGSVAGAVLRASRVPVVCCPPFLPRGTP
jgi:nucleotide-binding universal stress UspA family protein